MKPVTLCLCGGYDPAYPRTDVIIRGLESQQIDISHRHVEWGPPYKRAWRLKKLLRDSPVVSDIVMVPAMCHHEVPVVRKATRKPLVFDPLFSRYMTRIQDYRSAGKFSIHALGNYLIDRKSMRLADAVLADTQAHREYYCTKFGISPNKVHTVYVGCNTDDFFPVEKPDNPVLKVGFYGCFNPLQGADIIAKAALLLKDRRDIAFEMVGEGYTSGQVKDIVKSEGMTNIRFYGKVKYSELPGIINSWDVCLGIFGSTIKAQMVIPNKVFHYAGCGRPVITMDTPAIREIFTSNENIVLCKNSAESLAGAIEALCSDKPSRGTIGNKGRELIAAKYSPIPTGIRMKEIFDLWK
jgi:glycosyltransferase involved in cell wall biosynthesis